MSSDDGQTDLTDSTVEMRDESEDEALGVFYEEQEKSRQAHLNLERWWAAVRQGKKGPPTLVVSCHDWGEATGALTERFGVMFAVLNMSKAFVFGGAYEQGMMAQEKDIFARSFCHFMPQPEVGLPSASYGQRMRDLLYAREGRVYLNCQNPCVCVTGSKQNGYRMLADELVFPFYELRAAGVDMRDRPSPEDWFDEEQRLAWDWVDEEELSKRIVAQLETCRDKGVRHVVLSAFGCGAFQNPPLMVALAYRDALVGHEGDFDVVAFATDCAGYGPASNYDTFATVLGGNDVMGKWSVEFEGVLE